MEKSNFILLFYLAIDVCTLCKSVSTSFKSTELINSSRLVCGFYNLEETLCIAQIHLNRWILPPKQLDLRGMIYEL